jgi:hypothetical protein
MSETEEIQIPAIPPGPQVFYYAHLDAGDAVIAVAQSHSPIDSVQSVQIDSLREELLGQRYDRDASAAAGEPVFVHAPVVPAPEVRRITLGALQKRLGAMRVFALDTSAHPVCVALRSYLGRLTYVDLDDADLRPMLQMLVDTQQPEANPAFPGSGPLAAEDVDAIITAPVQEGERP